MKKHDGFTLVEGLLIVLVLSVIGFSGYYVWNQQNEDETETINTSQSIEKSSEQENTDSEVAEVENKNQAKTSDGWVVVVPEGWKNDDGDITSPDYKEFDAPQFAISSGALIRVGTDEYYKSSTIDQLVAAPADDYNTASSAIEISGVKLAVRTCEHTTKGECYRVVGKNGLVYAVDFVVSGQNNEDVKTNPNYDEFMKFLKEFVVLN